MFLIVPALILPFIGASAAGPQLTATPAKTGAGMPIALRGANFPKNMPVFLAWDGKPEGMPKVTAKGNGSFKSTVTVPAGAAAGAHTLTANTSVEQPTTQLTSISITVVTAPAPTPTPATPAPTPAPTAPPPTPTPTAAPTLTAPPTAAPTATPVATPGPTATPAPTAVPTATPVPTPAPTATQPTSCADGSYLAEYFDEMALVPSLRTGTACEASVNKNWALGAPGFGLRDNWFSVRWTSRTVFTSGTYTFNVTADDGMRLYVDGALLVDAWTTGGGGSATRAMSAGAHTLRVEYFENAGSAAAAFNVAVGTAPAPTPTPTGTPRPTPTVVPTPTPVPTATPAATPAPVPTAVPTPVPTSVPTPTPVPTPIAGLPAPVACSTSLAALITGAAAGSTLNLGACVYTSSIDIRKPIRLYGGTYRLPLGATAVHINADDVTIEAARFEGGGNTVKVYGRDRVKILSSSFTGMTETSINVLGPSVDDMLISGNTITQRVVTGHGYSPISGQGFGQGINNRLVIRNNTIDQGPSGVAWFGVEVWDNTGLVIEGNTLKGSSALVSIPRSDGAIVRNNRFDMTQAFWGIELADVDDAQVYGNTVWGTSGSISGDGRAFVQMHPGSGSANRNTIRNNTVSHYWAVANATGTGHTITNNCLTDVNHLYNYSFSGPVTISGNGPCP